jgi:hypothetical protein
VRRRDAGTGHRAWDGTLGLGRDTGTGTGHGVLSGVTRRNQPSPRPSPIGMGEGETVGLGRDGTGHVVSSGKIARIRCPPCSTRGGFKRSHRIQRRPHRVQGHSRCLMGKSRGFAVHPCSTRGGSKRPIESSDGRTGSRGIAPGGTGHLEQVTLGQLNAPCTSRDRGEPDPARVRCCRISNRRSQ